MSHLNATLTPRTRLRLARLIVEQACSCATAAAMFMVSPRTARKWAGRYRAQGKAGMLDRSSRPHHRPASTPPGIVRRVVHPRWRMRLGPVQIAGRLGMPASTAHAGADPLPDQPAFPHRPSDRRTVTPLRTRSPRIADPRGRHQVRQYPRRWWLELDGIEATRLLAERAPQVRVLILTMFDLDGPVFDALRAAPPGSSSRTPARPSCAPRSAPSQRATRCSHRPSFAGSSPNSPAPPSDAGRSVRGSTCSPHANAKS